MNDPPSRYQDPLYRVAQGWPFTATRQASEGNVQAMLYLAFVAFNNGNGSEALNHYRKAAKEFNNLEAALNIIKIYEFGLEGVSADLVKACQWMKKVLLMSESTPDVWTDKRIQRDVIVNYGWYMLGASTSAKRGKPQIKLPENKRNVSDGLKWLHRAAEMKQGDVASTLGNIYMTGQHPKIPLDYGKGMELLEIAANLGDGKCAYQLAISYSIGIIPVEEAKYRYWLKKSADLGYEEAIQAMASNSFPNGLGMKRKTAHKEIRKLEREKGIEEMLTTDETDKCSNPLCEATETDETGLFKICVACRHTKYCSKECQRAHWKSGHKQECPKLRAVKEELKKKNIDMIRNRIVED